jgi:hypothetical protein
LASDGFLTYTWVEQQMLGEREVSQHSRFQHHYEDLSPGDPRFGQITTLGWDTEIFGFPVGDYKLGDAVWLLQAQATWQEALRGWANRTGAQLISVGASASDRTAIELLNRCGGVSVDSSVNAELVRLQSHTLPVPRFAFRPVEATDMEAVERIAATAFQFGRYHTDPFFPRELADRRFVHWVRNAFADRDANNQLFVLGQPGEVRGFFHLVKRDTIGDLRLAATSPDTQGFEGFDLFVNALQELKRQGVRRVTAKLSALNTSVLNVYAALGFRFSQAACTYHWYPVPNTIRM